MAQIASIEARKILNSRGSWTIEVGATSKKGTEEFFSVPEGKSRGSAEAKCVSADKAVELINGQLAKKLVGFDLSEQNIDRLLLDLDGTKDKSNLGANTILAVSFVSARLLAKEEGVPLWKHIAKLSKSKPDNKHPQIFANLINGGEHADNNLDIQEFLLITKNSVFSKSVGKIVKVFHQIREDLGEDASAAVGDEGGFAINFRSDKAAVKYIHSFAKKNSLDIGIDAAGNNLNWNTLKTRIFYNKIYKNYGVRYIEDPFREREFEYFSKLKDKLGDKVQIVGDDLTVTTPVLVERAIKENAINAVIIKPNQIGTLTEALEAVRIARKAKYDVIASHRSGETNDSSIVDFAVGIAADGVKIGAPNRGERVAKYNRLLEIEQEMKGRK